jgi:hypothetical protein
METRLHIFVGYTESFNAKNLLYNYKKIGTTSNVRPTMCITFANAGKTEVRWGATIGWRA